MSEEDLRPWLVALAFTQVIEVPLYAYALRRHARRPLGLLTCLCVAFLASLITLPVVWFVMPLLFESYWRMAVAAETFVVLTEGALMRLCGLRRPWLWSLGVNATSALLGELSRAWLGFP
jgi:hypothetical protein